MKRRREGHLHGAREGVTGQVEHAATAVHAAQHGVIEAVLGGRGAGEARVLLVHLVQHGEDLDPVAAAELQARLEEGGKVAVDGGGGLESVERQRVEAGLRLERVAHAVVVGGGRIGGEEQVEVAAALHLLLHALHAALLQEVQRAEDVVAELDAILHEVGEGLSACDVQQRESLEEGFDLREGGIALLMQPLRITTQRMRELPSSLRESGRWRRSPPPAGDSNAAGWRTPLFDSPPEWS